MKWSWNGSFTQPGSHLEGGGSCHWGMPFQPRSIAFRLFKHKRNISSLFNQLFFFFFLVIFSQTSLSKAVYNLRSHLICIAYKVLQQWQHGLVLRVLVAGTSKQLRWSGHCWVWIVYEFVGWFTLLIFYILQSDFLNFVLNNIWQCPVQQILQVKCFSK